MTRPTPPFPRPVDRPPDGLRALVDTIVESGNAVAAPFYRTQSGWVCELRDPIAFDLLRGRQLPSGVTLLPDRDAISDDASQSFIAGRRNWAARIEDFFQSKYLAARANGPPITLQSLSRIQQQQFAHLAPIVGFEVSVGNTIDACDWFRPREGQLCRMAQPLHLDEIAAMFELPENLQLDTRAGTVVDTLSGYLICGPDAQP